MNNEETLNDLLVILDVQIDNEKGDRDLHQADSEDLAYHAGRIDGVDTARALIESYFLRKELEVKA